MDTKCPKCGCAPIPGCDGKGYFRVDDTTVRPCRNMYIKQLSDHLGAEIAISKHVTKSPLYEAGDKGGPPKVDRTNENLVLRVQSWPYLLPHLKWSLGCKGLDFRFKILTDLEVVNVKVGATSRASQGVSRAESDEVYNHLGDLIEDYALIILQVGRMGYKNRAASGALYELLLIRESQRRPVWIVVDGEKPWDKPSPKTGNYGYSYSSEVQAYLNRWFDEIDMPAVDPGDRVLKTNNIVEDEDGEEEYFTESSKAQVPEKPPPVTPPRNKISFEAQVSFEDMNLDNILPGGNSKPKWRKR